MKAVITVTGKDTVGIIADVAAVCAKYRANILDITQSVLSEYFAMIMLAELQGLTVPFSQFADELSALGEEKGYASVLKTLAERGVVREGGVFVAEMTAVQKAEETPGWELVRDRRYGKTRICLWRRQALH